jgi:hypothetical protein
LISLIDLIEKNKTNAKYNKLEANVAKTCDDEKPLKICGTEYLWFCRKLMFLRGLADGQTLPYQLVEPHHPAFKASLEAQGQFRFNCLSR